jgi:monofunctional biosynthetic peptidoglycan transglycosylase
LGKIIKWCILLFILAAAAVAAFHLVYPDVGRLRKENPGRTAFMEYREREWKAKGRKVRIVQKWVPLAGISPFLVKAVLISEDDKFWSHKGFDVEAIHKALEKDLQSGKARFGGSTISQQLVKNLYLTPEKSAVRKAREAVITWRMERVLTKRRILELYLNVVEWGEGIFGAEAAAQRYFGKPALLLTAQEAALLATVLPNPRRYRVDNPGPYVLRRSKVIYDIMVRRGIVVPEYEEVMGPVPGEPSSPLAPGQ